MRFATFLTWTCVVAAALGFSAAAGAADDCPLDARIAPLRAAWHAGEPLEVRVQLVNRLDRPAGLALSYPSLGGRGFSGIAFGLSENMPEFVPADSLERVISIAPHATLELIVYANKYLPPLAAGPRRIHWRLKIACLDAGGGFLAPGAFSGSFMVNIDPSPLPRAAEIAAAYADRLEAPDSMTRQQAIEALSNMSDPAVLPELKKLYQYGYRNDALEALRKFDGNPAAARVLIEILAAAEAGPARNALHLAASWKSDLPVALVEEVFRGPPVPARLAIIEYLGARGSAAYEALLRRLAAADDQALSSAAKDALAKFAPKR